MATTRAVEVKGGNNGNGGDNRGKGNNDRRDGCQSKVTGVIT